LIRTSLLVLAVLAQPVLADRTAESRVLSTDTLYTQRKAESAPAGDDRGQIDEASARSADAEDPRPRESLADEVMPPPPTYKGNDVNVTEKLGARVPLDATFRDHDGKLVTLGDVLAGEIPTILTFNYADCPMLCSLQLNGLTAVLPAIGERVDNAMFRVGAQFRIVTIALEPGESLDKMQKMRAKYLERVPEGDRETARAGWTFLLAPAAADASSIARVAASVGFSYTYLPERAEWAHPAALIFLDAAGTVTRYVYGIEFEPAVMRESIFKAGMRQPAAAVGFMNRCYHYDPDANNHSAGGVLALRIGAAGAVVLLLSGLFVLHFIRRQGRGRPGVNRS
jgi:protein SCO1/2